VRCCMLDACTADDAIVFVVMVCFWCYLGQVYPGFGTATLSRPTADQAQVLQDSVGIYFKLGY
jgi:hypothetical protein